MPSYLIRFKDGSYHFKQGIGHSTNDRKDAAYYYSLESAEKMVWELAQVDAIITNDFSKDVVRKY